MRSPPPPQPAPSEPGGDDELAAKIGDLKLDRWPDVVRLLVAGHGFAAHTRLLELRKTIPHDADRAVIDEALKDRRLFAEPAKSPPSLGRLNGFGMGMYGQSAFDRRDGTYVKTRSFSAVWVPIFPVDQWLVSDAENGGWYFHSRIPLAREMRFARIGVGCLAAAAALVATGVARWSATHSDLHVLNGLGVAAELSIDGGEPIAVPPDGRVTRVLSSGKHRFRCVVKGRVVDEREADVSGTADLVAYNVAGAAPLYVEDVIYREEHTARKDDKQDDGKVTALAGEVFVQRESVDYVFRDSPDEIQISKHTSSAVKRHAGVADGGWRTAMRMADDPSKTAAVASGVALAQPEDAAVVEETVEVAQNVLDENEFTQFCEKLAAAAPDSVVARRSLQDARLFAGEDDRARAEAQAAHQRAPSPQSAAMLARVVPNEQALPLVADALAKAGADPIVREMAFRVHARAGRFDEAARDADVLIGKQGRTRESLLVRYAKVLAVSDRARAALDAVESSLKDDARRPRHGVPLVGAYALLLRSAGDAAAGRAPPAKYLAELVADYDEEVESAADRAAAIQAGVPPEMLCEFAVAARDERALEAAVAMLPSEQRAAASFPLVVWRDPEAAVRGLANTPAALQESIEGLDPPLLIVYAAELGRAGRTADAEDAHSALPAWLRAALPDAKMTRLPEVARWRDEMDPTLQSALLFAHALREQDAVRRGALLAEAKKLDLLGEVHAW